MATAVNLRKTLDRKQWEMVTPYPGVSASGGTQVMAVSKLGDNLIFYGNQFLSQPSWYRTDEDAWLMGNGVTYPAGSPAAGTCACHHPNGPTGTASAGSSTTITTTTTVVVNLGPVGSFAGYRIRITAGTGAGQEATILSNTLGANSVITTAAWGTNPDNTSVYLLLTGRAWYQVNGAVGLRYFDYATGAWSSALAVPNTTFTGTDSALVATPGYYGATGLGTGFATGTATSGSATTVVNTGKAWTVNQWANFQVRITAGTGAGKLAIITSNTATTLTFPTVTTALDVTSQYIIEGSDDAIYYINSGSVLLQRYNIGANTWTSLSPGTARTNAPGVGTGSICAWVKESTDTLFNTENSIVNGRRIYSFNALSSALCLDYYDIPSNAWTNGVAIGRMNNVSGFFNNQGSSGTVIGDNWYIGVGGTGTTSNAGQVFRLNLPRQTLDPWSNLLYPASNTALGQRIFDVFYTDGGTTIRWLYLNATGSSAWFRCMVI